MRFNGYRQLLWMEALDTNQIEHFVDRGYVRLDEAFPRDVAERGREILWRDTGCDPLDRSTWTRPVIWLWDYAQEPFRQAVNMPLLHRAFDQLVGRAAGCHARAWEPFR